MLRLLVALVCICALIFSQTINTYAAQRSDVALVKMVEVEPVKVIDPEDVDCLTQNIYFESRNQNLEGQFAVAEVVINRTHDPRFPDSVCKVVRQKSKSGCQFSWYCDGKSDRMVDKDAERIARFVATSVLLVKTNFTGNATFYHANYVSPKWAANQKGKQIQDHIFYSSI